MDKIFVKIEKDGVTLVIHPSAVEDHQRVGWVVIEEGVALPKSSKGAKDEPTQEEPAPV